MTKGNQCEVPVKRRKPQRFIWSALGSISPPCETRIKIYRGNIWICFGFFYTWTPLSPPVFNNNTPAYLNRAHEALYVTLILLYIVQTACRAVQVHGKCAPRVLWEARVNGKIQDPLGWRRITSHRVSWGGRHRCCIDPADKHWMAGSSRTCQVSPNGKRQDSPGWSLERYAADSQIRRRYVKLAELMCCLPVIYIISPLHCNWWRYELRYSHT